MRASTRVIARQCLRWVGCLGWLAGGLGLVGCTPSPHTPGARWQTDPGWPARAADGAWRYLAMRRVVEIQTRRERDRATIAAELTRLPPGSVEAPADREAEIAVRGTYGQLPEVMVDHDAGAIFPQPLPRPQRFSWRQVAAQARAALTELDAFDRGLARYGILATPERVARFPELDSAWDALDSRVALLTQHVRYLDTWVPQLWRQWRGTQRGGRPLPYQLANAVAIQHADSHPDPRLLDTLRELLRPTRVLKRPFLPEVLHAGTINLPIATDIPATNGAAAGRRFLAEIEGALATHWNQSAWAREQGVTFHILWTRLPRDDAFARGRATLEEHLRNFPPDRAALTTGGLTTYVHGQALVLGPGKINPRTLAHELGHLLGFGDCYLRTLSSEPAFGLAAALGLGGLGVLEWDNPLFPDDLMCDNQVGSPRAEAW